MTDPGPTPPIAMVTAEMLAQALGCSAYNVRQLAVNGVIPKTGRGQYPLFPSIRAYCEHMRNLVTGRGEGTPAAERRRLASAQADLVQLKARKASGELVEAALAQEQWVRVMSTLRARLLAIPTRVGQAGALSGQSIAELDREIRAALEELANDGGHDRADEEEAPADDEAPAGVERPDAQL